MNRNTRKRSVYPTVKQKKKLLEFMTKYPELALGKVTQNFSYNDAQKLWITVSNECNALPGSRKTWRQWRKTWQDIKSKTKKRHENGFARSVFNFTEAEQQALGIKMETSTSQNQESTEFVNSGLLEPDSAEGSFIIEDESHVSYYESQSEDNEEKMSNSVEDNISKSVHHKSSSSDDEHASTCVFNCKLLVKHEQKKVEIKEDYLNFKKDYLRQKLKLMKEQTEALRVIARELTKNS